MKTLVFAALAAVVLGSMLTSPLRAAPMFDIHYSAGTTGTGQQLTYAPTNSISGTMICAMIATCAVAEPRMEEMNMLARMLT